MNTGQGKQATTEIDAASFEAEVLRSKQPVMVVFWAPWSRPCRTLKVVLEELTAECAGRVKIVALNADDNPDLGVWYGIQSIPTLLYFVDGNVRARIVGTASKQAILAKMTASSPGSAPTPADTPPRPSDEHGTEI